MGVKDILQTVLVLLYCFYWKPVEITYQWFFGDRRNYVDRHASWSCKLCDFLKISFVKLPGSQPINKQRTILLVNHRSQADFFIHDVVVGHQANVLARYMVAVIFPILYLCTSWTVWFFRRGGIRDFEKFNLWLDSCFPKSTRKSLLAYPEGHRMFKATSVGKLKVGMIKYAYNRKYPVQIVMSFGNEEVLNQKMMRFSFNKTIYHSADGVINPTDFATEEQFVKHVDQRFRSYFDQIYKKVLQVKGEQNPTSSNLKNE